VQCGVQHARPGSDGAMAAMLGGYSMGKSGTTVAAAQDGKTMVVHRCSSQGRRRWHCGLRSGQTAATRRSSDNLHVATYKVRRRVVSEGNPVTIAVVAYRGKKDGGSSYFWLYFTWTTMTCKEGRTRVRRSDSARRIRQASGSSLTGEEEEVARALDR
jgi:hypothetical protein